MEESSEEQLKDQLKEAEEATETAITKSPMPANSEDMAAVNNNISNSQKSREEGELSSCDDDDYPATCSPLVSSGNVAVVEPVQSGETKKSTQDIEEGKSADSNNGTGAGDGSLRGTLQTNQQKSYDKSKGPFVPFVISFSDDDSSDSEHSLQNIVSTNGRNTGGNRSKRPPATTLLTSQKLKETKSDAKFLPKKVSQSRTFVSSMIQTNSSTSQNNGPYLRSRNPNTVKRVVGLDHGLNLNLHLNTSKLQDLRQLIAIRENELKRKPAGKIKNSVSASCRDYINSKLSDKEARGRRAVSADNVEFEAKEPERKRPRTDELKLTGHGDVPARQSTLASEKSLLVNMDRHKADEPRREILPHASLSSIPGSRGEVESRGPISSTNLPPVGVEEGIGIMIKSSAIDRDCKLLNPETSSEKHTETRNQTAENITKKTASLNDPCFSNWILPGSSDMDVQALLDLEESHDKELEEAQELRRKCEVEERDARNTYLRAQRALAEANARCSYLYRKREIYSAQVRSLMMENSNLFWSMNPNDKIGSQLNLSNKFSNVNTHLIPTSSGQVRAEINAYNRLTFDSNVHLPNDIHQNIQDQYEPGKSVACDRAIEPGDNSSEPHKEDSVANGVYYSPDGDSIFSGDEDREMHDTNGSGLEYEKKDESSGDTEKERNDGLDGEDQLDNSRDSLLLEASLRAKLFERLQMNALTKKRGPVLVEPLEEGTGNDDSRKNKEHDSGEMPPSGGHEEGKHTDLAGHQPTTLVALSCPILRSAFFHLKIALVQSQTRLPEMQSCNADNENEAEHLPNGSKKINSNGSSSKALLMDLDVEQSGSYSCNHAINPSWPLCMYELRGKCNDDECPWQHVRNYTCNDDPGARWQTKFGSSKTLAKCVDCLVLYPPRYLVDLDVLQDNLEPYNSIFTRGSRQCGRKYFSSALVLSGLLPTDLSGNEPILHGGESHFEANASWNRQLLDLHNRNGLSKQAEKLLGDNEQALEMALLNLSYEANKQKGRSEALRVLAPAVEAHPTSEILWIIYLQIYYSNQNSVGKHDMFQTAVEHNKNSYELWLLYINSRTHIDDRLAAYDAALAALCQHVSGSDRDAAHISQCILDIFLQMVNCLCMSGDVLKALEKIYVLVPSAERSGKLTQSFLHDLLACLTIYDKCIFWVCCVYLTIYKKLPDAICHHFEFRKELHTIEWPDAQLTSEGKQQANLLLEIAVDSLALHIDAKSLKSEETLRAAHQFAFNHVMCVAVLEGFDCSRNLLENYVKTYPSCLELVLLSAWTEYEFGYEKFLGFEKALSNWLEDIPGIQCLWNQYAVSALQSGNFDFGKELMERWFHSVWKVRYPQNGTVDSINNESFWSSLQSDSASCPLPWRSCCNQSDVVFGLLNFSLHKVLHNDHTEARLALDRALKAATAGNYVHCVTEHALASLTSSLPHNRDAQIINTVKTLSGYLVDARASCGSEPLSRGYIRKIKKRGVQHLVNKLLSPLSDFSLVNSVLEVWYGPHLLPLEYDKLSDMVEFVEALMGILPSNYELAISVCKHLTRSSKTEKVPANVSFWASSLLLNALFQAVPQAPESVFSEAADILPNVTDIHAVSETFHKRALAVYPFSVKLWKSYLGLFSDANDVAAVKEAARAKGINLG